jgi:4-amino-4-deoxy-L-arabinose transferase-like glycosyltransferase
MRLSLNLIFILVIFLAVSQFFLVSLSSPIVFGDEGYYASTSRWIAENHIIPEFRPLAENKVYQDKADIIPLFFMLETFFFYFGEFGAKLLFPLLSLVTALFAYVFVKSVSDKKIAIISALTLLMTPALITYGVMGYTDVLLLLLVICTAHFTTKAFDEKKQIHIILAGIFSGLTVLTKQSGPFIFIFIIIYFLINFYKNINKDTIKLIATIFLIGLLVVTPLIIRNLSLFSDICYKTFSINKKNCEPLFLEQPNKIEDLEFDGRNTGSGTEAGLLSFGILNYFLFASGLTITLLFLFGLGFLIVKRREKIFKISLAMILSTLPILYFSLDRAEDTARYLLPMNLGIIMIVGYLVNEIYKKSKDYNKYLAYAVIAVVLLSLWVYGQEKIDTMYIVKGFSPGFLDGCNWIRENTAEEAVLFSTYEYHTRYQCNRNVAVSSDKEEILLSFNDTSYEHIKFNGINYIFVLRGLISEGKFSENYPVEFINYIENSNKFKKVYDNSDVYGQNGIIIYEVL